MEKLVWKTQYFKYTKLEKDGGRYYSLYHRVGSTWEHIITTPNKCRRQRDYTFDIPPVKTRTLASIGVK